MTICVSCRRRVDRDRSFCASCGSAVFTESTDQLRAVAKTVRNNLGLTAPSAAAARRRAASLAPQVRDQLSAEMQARARQAAAGAGSAVWSLIKFGVFLYVVYLAFNAWNAAKDVPEVRHVVEQLERGDEPDLQPALDALRQRFEAWVLGTDAETPPASNDRPTPPPRRDTAPRRR